MSQTPVSVSGLVRVTVSSGSRRVDLVLPGTVPVAELVPELARSVGLLEAGTVYGGYRLVTSDGRRLETDSGLTLQGVGDGSVLTVAAGVDDDLPHVYDDVVEAMTDVVEHDLKPWEPGAGRRTALAAAVLLMTLGAVALLLIDAADRSLAGAAAGVVAAGLVTGAIVLSRAQGEQEAAVTVALLGTGYAAVAGLLLAPGHVALGYDVAVAGLGAVVAGVVALLGLGPGRTLVVPPIVAGAVFGVTGLVVEGDVVDGPVLLTVLLTVVVLAGSVFPWLALGLTGTRVDQLYSTADITADPDQVDPARVASDARVAHEILVAISATVGLLLVLVAPYAASLGVSGTVLAVVASLVVMLRTRQYRTGSEVLVGLVSGIAGLGVVALALVLGRDEARGVTAAVLAVSGAVLLTLTLLPAGPSVRRGRFGDVVETVCLLALLPLLVVATGLFDAIAS